MLSKLLAEFLELDLSLDSLLVFTSPVCFAGLLVFDLYKLILCHSLHTIYHIIKKGNHWIIKNCDEHDGSPQLCNLVTNYWLKVLGDRSELGGR